MDLDGGEHFEEEEQRFEPHVVPRGLCCVCSVSIDPNQANLCMSCLQSHVDITKDLQKEYTVTYCPECNRWLQPPKYWLKAERESKELMTLCLKKIKGMNKYTLVNAVFQWTEPHSKRLKLKLELQQEVFAHMLIQQSVVIEYTEHWAQCERCAKAATGQPQWDAVVQLRQKVSHMRTFLYLEQLILKHRMHENAISIESHPSGLDFFFNHRSHALSFTDFVSKLAPVKRIDAEQLVSHDSKSNTAVQHHTFSLEISPVCREDIVCLPKRFYKENGGLGPIVLVHKVYSSIVLLDPSTLRATEVMSRLYWEHPFPSLSTTRQLVEFFVLDIRPTGEQNGKYMLADAEVELANAVGEGEEYTVRTHLGAVLQPGDSAMGYLLGNLNWNNDAVETYPAERIPDVILVRKHYPNQVRKRSRRKWKLRRLQTREAEGNAKTDQNNRERDMEEFCDDLERDEEYRTGIKMYRDESKANKKRQQQRVGEEAGPASGVSSEMGEDDIEVPLDELLDEFAELQEEVGAEEETPGESAEGISGEAELRKRSRERSDRE